MKLITTFVSLVFMTTVLHPQDCNIGNDLNAPGFILGAEFTPNRLLGVNFTLSETGVLHSLNMIGQGTGTEFQMAIYDDNAGVPQNLITFTAPSIVGTGVVTLPVSPVELSPGDYWIMVVYNINGTSTNQSLIKTNDPNSVVYFTELTFGNPIPTDTSGFIRYTGQDLRYFAEIGCGTLSIQDLATHPISVVPNPAKDYVKVENLKENTLIEIYDVTGRKVMAQNMNPTNNHLDLSSMALGTYLLNCNHKFASKFVKN